ncbi:Rpr2-domain-containing protein [Aspergillus campestris IBT 28561]|uniref:Rpr2-domain-containing protein n=1 Tax=Aspergillus campestris (strain IBT 28561) TaxID=1392248 RepID=A0A2I1CXD6_ASPC2|nr:Rpr2-domain-containing protein [Aspergillus campestris IBT 28561]PKY02271.1 Rpr2-domain-containing protein [Aspergillus campestris IBT 28561]
MAKPKAKKANTGGANSHIRARLDYLNKAAAFLQSTAQLPGPPARDTPNDHDEDDMDLSPNTARVVPQITGVLTDQNSPNNHKTTTTPQHLTQLSRNYISQMRGVSLKTRTRLSIDVKRSFCKRCDTILTPGVTSTQEIQNASRDRRKPWADVRVVRCGTCQTEKRFPQTEKRSRKLPDRRKDKEQKQVHVSNES